MPDETPSTGKLLDAEKLNIHFNLPSDSESPTPNLSLVFCGEPKVFETHDNGGRPFKVGVTRDHVTVHANYNVLDDEGQFKEGKAPLIAAFACCEKVFVGVSSGSSWCDHDVGWEGRFGNSILVCLAGGKSEVIVGSNPPNIQMNYRTNQVEPFERFRLEALFAAGQSEAPPYCTKMPSQDESGATKGQFVGPARSYVFIGDCIYIFEPPENDEIVDYHSMIGSSDVPYPVAVGKKYLYFMLDMKYVPRTAIKEAEWLHDPGAVDKESDGPRWEEAYCWFYTEFYDKKRKDIEALRFPHCISLGNRG